MGNCPAGSPLRPTLETWIPNVSDIVLYTKQCNSYFFIPLYTYGVELNTLPTIFLKLAQRGGSSNNSTFAAIGQFKTLRTSNTWEQGNEQTSYSISNGVNSWLILESFAIIHFNDIYIPFAVSKNVYNENNVTLLS